LIVRRNSGLTIAVLVAVCLLSACGRWSGAKQEKMTQQRVDSQLEIGLDEAAFKQRFPDAEIWQEEGGMRDYLVSVERLCVVCSSGGAFIHSKDYYVRSVRFQDAKLVSIDPVELNY
jgi:hypothetical protein